MNGLMKSMEVKMEIIREDMSFVFRGISVTENGKI